MPVRLLPLLLSVLAALLVLGAGAPDTHTPASEAARKVRADKPPRVNLDRTKELWATINTCDTAEHANTIGIRGSMPGLRDRRAKLRMRFQVQYKAKEDGEWRDAGPTADSGYKTVGRTRRRIVESGHNFTFMPPTDGGSHLLRGSVRFRWVRKGRTLERERRITEPGHKSTAGADPEGYSAAQCEITQP